jgi:hypothetical protein
MRRMRIAGALVCPVPLVGAARANTGPRCLRPLDVEGGKSVLMVSKTTAQMSAE